MTEHPDMVYVATVNVPGYLPMTDEPTVFDSASQAWAFLADERERDEDTGNPDALEYSDTLETLRYLGSDDHEHGNPCEDHPTNADGTGTVYGDTPGYTGRHDLGMAYCVSLVARADVEGDQ
jgi:hypothetical protein